MRPAWAARRLRRIQQQRRALLPGERGLEDDCYTKGQQCQVGGRGSAPTAAPTRAARAGCGAGPPAPVARRRTVAGGALRRSAGRRWRRPPGAGGDRARGAAVCVGAGRIAGDERRRRWRGDRAMTRSRAFPRDAAMRVLGADAPEPRARTRVRPAARDAARPSNAAP